jgi:RNA polymerase sigma-70 factor, ECF subfamily
MAPTVDIAADLEQHRSYLMRIARLQLRDNDLAEDVVQETMLAALAAKSFSGDSSLRTWLTSILKHKVVDVIRKRQRRSEVHESQAEAEFDPSHDEFDSPFDENGSWEAKPAAWGDPEQALNQRQFLDTMALCMENLPANTARVFVMREYMELEVAEISRELSLAAAHIYVILYRARAALRQCLEKKWFGNDSKGRKERNSP